MSDLLDLDIVNASIKLKNKEISSVELTQAYIHSSLLTKELNIYITETFDLALQQAKESDSRRSKEKSLSDLDGIPVAIKDIFLTKGILTSNASYLLSNFIAPYESTVTANLHQAGAVCLGKVNLDEFAMGSSNTYSYYGTTYNPWKGNDGSWRSPGGSSGGSAAAVSARSALGSLGTDTGGSIRQPASFCGLVGMKPTYGVCSRYGIIAFSSSLDQAGPITRTVKDNALLLNAIAGYDSKDSSMLPFDKPDYTSRIGQDVKGMKLGIPKEIFEDALPSEIKSMWENSIKMMESQGAEIIEVSIPALKASVAVYYILNTCEGFSNFSRFDGIRYGQRAKHTDLNEMINLSREQGWGSEVKRRMFVGSYTLLEDNFEYYEKAAKVRRAIYDECKIALEQSDALLLPTVATDAFDINNMEKDPVTMYFVDLFTIFANLVGLPALNIPVQLSSNGLPLGMQLVGKHYHEAELYQYAYALENKVAFDWTSSIVKEKKLHG